MLSLSFGPTARILLRLVLQTIVAWLVHVCICSIPVIVRLPPLGGGGGSQKPKAKRHQMKHIDLLLSRTVPSQQKQQQHHAHTTCTKVRLPVYCCCYYYPSLFCFLFHVLPIPHTTIYLPYISYHCLTLPCHIVLCMYMCTHARTHLLAPVLLRWCISKWGLAAQAEAGHDIWWHTEQV